jgi:hypothetical protein
MRGMRWVILGVAAAVSMAGCGDEGSADSELGAASGGITLNTTSWRPYEEGASWMEAGIGGIVRVDANGCVYLGSDRSDLVRDIAWPAGYSASRQSDGSMVIMNPDGVVVAATGHRVAFGGGAVPGIELQCRAQGPRDRSEPGDSGVIMVTDVLPPLKD